VVHRDVELAWLAGLLEGEGYFGMINNHVGGKVYRYPRVGVTMSDRDVVERVGAMFGLKVTAINPGPQSNLVTYRFTLTGARAAQLMVDLRPMLGTRRQAQIDSALSEYSRTTETCIRRSHSNRIAALKRYGHDTDEAPSTGTAADTLPEQARDHHRAQQVSESTGRFHRDQRNRVVRQLRGEDPERWTYPALAAAVGCSPELIAAIVKGRA
jgi:hypothetical protein